MSPLVLDIYLYTLTESESKSDVLNASIGLFFANQPLNYALSSHLMMKKQFCSQISNPHH